MQILNVKTAKRILFTLCAGSLLLSCNIFKTARYDQHSFQKVIEIKVETLNVMNKATTAYTANQEAVDHLKNEIHKIVLYEKNKPNNEISHAMWQVLNNENKNLLAGFFKRWKEKTVLGEIFINEAKIQIDEAMNLLIEYEGKKDREAKEKLLDFLVGS